MSTGMISLVTWPTTSWMAFWNRRSASRYRILPFFGVCWVRLLLACRATTLRRRCCPLALRTIYRWFAFLFSHRHALVLHNNNSIRILPGHLTIQNRKTEYKKRSFIALRSNLRKITNCYVKNASRLLVDPSSVRSEVRVFYYGLSEFLFFFLLPITSYSRTAIIVIPDCSCTSSNES